LISGTRGGQGVAARVKGRTEATDCGGSTGRPTGACTKPFHQRY